MLLHEDMMEAASYDDGPPAKKRRFFANTEDQAAGGASGSSSASASPASPTAPVSKPRFFQDATSDSHSAFENSSDHASHSNSAKRSPLSEKAVDETTNRVPVGHQEAGPSNHAVASLAFDHQTFESFVGDKISPDVLAIIQQNCGDSIERAVNMYFDGTWKKFKNKSPSLGAFARTTRQPIEPPSVPSSDVHTAEVTTRSAMPASRYIGAFGAEGWATRSGTNLLKHGDVVRIERQKTQPPQPAALKGKAKLGVSVATPRANNLASKRVDVIVRFTNTQGVELGRLAKDTADWVAPLLDQGVCKFEGTCVYAPERLRTNDTVFLQLRCFMLRSAFHRRGFSLADNRTTGVFEEKETSEERELRLRQVALVRLLQEVNLIPITVNAAAAKQSRQGLLDAAEMAEKKSSAPPKTSNR